MESKKDFDFYKVQNLFNFNLFINILKHHTLSNSLVSNLKKMSHLDIFYFPFLDSFDLIL